MIGDSARHGPKRRVIMLALPPNQQRHGYTISPSSLAGCPVLYKGSHALVRPAISVRSGGLIRRLGYKADDETSRMRSFCATNTHSDRTRRHSLAKL